MFVLKEVWTRVLTNQQVQSLQTKESCTGHLSKKANRTVMKIAITRNKLAKQQSI